jgi:ribosomal protein S18 acetylase RimI-like enzyme
MNDGEPANWTIRECRTTEVEALLTLWRDAGATVSVTDNAEAICRAMKHPAAFVLVAEADGRVVGSIIGAFDGWRGNIYRLAVHPAFRRRGVARALTSEAEIRLARQGTQRITALVVHDHSWATGFWQAAGYERDGRLVRYMRTLVESRPSESC